MSEAIGLNAGSVAVTRRFYFFMSLTCFAVALLGFMPTYFVPLATGQFRAPAVQHIHGLLFFGWTVLFCVQTWLVSSGGTLAHRNWGMLGIALASAMVLMTLVVTVQGMNIYDAAGMGPAKRAFSWVQISGIAFFGGVFALAIMEVKRGEIHKRLMMLATISLLDAPIARWFAVVLSPPVPAGELPPPPPVILALPASFIADLLVVAAIVFDWRTRGKPHLVYLYGGGALLLLQVTRAAVAATPFWDSVALWLQGFGH